MLKAIGGTIAVLFGCSSIITVLANPGEIGFSTPYQIGSTLASALGVLMFPLGFYVLLRKSKKRENKE